MLDHKPLELSSEKQSQFWAAPVDHYKAALTAGPLFRFTSAYVGQNILDVGAADGSLMRYLRQARTMVDVAGIDLAPKNPDVIKGNCTSLPFDDGSFDTVYMTDIVEHLATGDLIKCFQESMRVLKSNGHLIVATVNDENLAENVILCPHCGENFHRWGHCQSFTAETLRQRMTAVGYEGVFFKTTNLGFLARRPFLARLIYGSGLAEVYKQKIFHHDLLAVGRKK